MAIVDYDTLVSAVKTWAIRNDSTFSAQIPVFIALAEDRIYNGSGDAGDPTYSPPLRSQVIESTVEIPLVAGVGVVPDALVEIRSVRVAGQYRSVAHYSPERFADVVAQNPAGPVVAYTVVGSSIETIPRIDGNLSIVGYQQYAPITVTNKTNPLIARHGLIYLEATLYEAFAFQQEVEMAMAHLARARGMVEAANRTARNISHAGTTRIRPRNVITA